MKRFFVFFHLFLLVYASASSQIQQGLVKTPGRINADGEYVPGKGISNVLVKVKGANEVNSGNTGCFSLKLLKTKFYLENVIKNGYVLVDNDVLSKEYSISPDTFKIVLAAPQEQLDAEVANYRRIRRNLTRQLQKREDEIEELYASNKILKAERDSALQQLYSAHANNEKLIKDMVERYSRIDFDNLDEYNRKISEYILEGELVKADSMLNSKGDIHSRIKQLRSQERINEAERAELDEREAALLKSEEYARKNLDDIAADCYHKFEMFKIQHLNDSAAYYIELRAGLDTTNIDWQFDAGVFISEYLAEYDKAVNYYKLALQSALLKDGGRHPDVAASYNNIGYIYNRQGDYAKALEYYNKAVEILLSVLGERHPDVATSYNNIGYIYNRQGDYAKALEYYNKSLEIRLSVLGERHPDVATSFNNIGQIYHSQGDYAKALEYYNKSLEILLSVLGERHPDVATSFNNIGQIYYSQGDYAKALEYHNKSLEILLSVLGERHPYVATIYNNIGLAYHSQGDYAKPLEYCNKSLEIRLSVLGERHPDVATSYNNIGLAYHSQGDYAKALEYHNKSLEIRLSVLGERHPDVATSYNNIGGIYYSQGDYAKALEYLDKSYGILKDFLPDEHPYIKTVRGNIEYLKSKINKQ